MACLAAKVTCRKAGVPAAFTTQPEARQGE